MELLEVLKSHLGAIITSLSVAFLLGLWGVIRSFFLGIKRMENKIDQLESDLSDNSRSDEDLKKYVDMLIEKKLKQ